MAESAGLVFGVLGAFNDAVQCFEYIQLARNFDRDFQTATMKLDIAKLRLSRWGRSVGLDQVAGGVQSLPSMLASPQDLKKAEGNIKQITELFEEAKRKSAKLQPNMNIGTYEDKDLDEATTSLHRKLQQLSLKRYKPSRVLKAMKWALYYEKQLNRLLEDIRELVDGLIELFPAAEPARRQLCTEDGAELASDKNMALLQPLISEQDPELGAAIQLVISDGAQTFNISFTGSTNHGLQQGYFSGQQTNNFGKSS